MDAQYQYPLSRAFYLVLLASLLIFSACQETTEVGTDEAPRYYGDSDYACSATREHREKVRQSICDPNSNNFGFGFVSRYTGLEPSLGNCAQSLLEIGSEAGRRRAKAVNYFNACGYREEAESTRVSSLYFAESFSRLMQFAGLPGDFKSRFLTSFNRTLASGAGGDCSPENLKSSQTDLEREQTMESVDSTNEEFDETSDGILWRLDLRESNTGQIVARCRRNSKRSSRPTSELEGFWKSSFVSTTDVSVNGLECPDGGSGDFKIADGILDGSATNTLGIRFHVSGRSIDQVMVTGSFNRDGAPSGSFVGELRGGRLVGTWWDRVECRGNWTAQRM